METQDEAPQGHIDINRANEILQQAIILIQGMTIKEMVKKLIDERIENIDLTTDFENMSIYQFQQNLSILGGLVQEKKILIKELSDMLLQ